MENCGVSRGFGFIYIYRCVQIKILLNYIYKKFECDKRGTYEHMQVPTRTRWGQKKPILKQKWSGGGEWETHPKPTCYHFYL